MKYFIIILSFLVLISCSDDDLNFNQNSSILSEVMAQQPVELGDVIACASGSDNNNEVIVYLYPRPGVTDLRYFETESISVDNSDFSLYKEVDLPIEDFFNGHLETFTRQTVEERWVIATFLDNGVLSASNPIRLKHQTQNTIFTDEIQVDQTESTMPIFEWDNLADDNNVIYFQVVADAQNNLLSGTYTFEEQFQYYILDNVVLNVTETPPPTLIPQDNYSFTVMGVSLDNWVNVLAMRDFVAE